MVDFILVPPTDYIRELLNLVPAFAVSDEYGVLDTDLRQIPGLVFAAFTKFFEASLHDADIVKDCRAAIEHFAATNKPDAENYLVTEVFENLREPDLVVPYLLERSRNLFDTWIGGGR